MTESEIRNLFEQWVDAWSSGDWEHIRSLYAEDAILYQAPIKKTLVGIDHIIAWRKDLFEASSDARLTIRELYVVGDIAVMEFNIVGTHTGRFFDYESTGRKFDIDSCLVFKVKDGKIIKHTTYLDMATVLRALGLLTIPGVRPEAA